MTEHHLRSLQRKAADRGITILEHDERSCPYLVSVDRRTVYILRALPTAERFRLACQALQTLGEGDLLAPASPAWNHHVVQLPPCDFDADSTLPDGRSTGGWKLAGTPFAGTPGTPCCEMCDSPTYAILQGMCLCRHHLYSAVRGSLEPSEVRSIRQHHGVHPEASFERYDDRGIARPSGLSWDGDDNTTVLTECPA